MELNPPNATSALRLWEAAARWRKPVGANTHVEACAIFVVRVCASTHVQRMHIRTSVRVCTCLSKDTWHTADVYIPTVKDTS